MTYVWIALAALSAVFVATELGCRFIYPRVSRVEPRARHEYARAIAPRDNRPVVLMVGNSLLLTGIDFPRLQSALAGEVDARRFVVENTAFFDWYYGIRKLIKDGARPDAILLALSPVQLCSKRHRGEYSARRLTSTSDLLALSRDLDLHPTSTANMIFANFSAFFGIKSELRNLAFTRLMPDLPKLTTPLTNAPEIVIPPAELAKTAGERAARLRQESERHGVRIVLLAPPSSRYDAILTMQSAAAANGIETAVLFTADTYSPADYFDGFHLNNAGARRWTEDLAAYIRDTAPQWAQQRQARSAPRRQASR